MNAEFYMMMGNAVFLFGTTFLFLKVIKNRNCIKDFDVTGSGLTFCGMIFTTAALIELNMWWAILISAPTVLFWLFAFIFSYKGKNIIR
jgi:hypothetical protein